MNISTTICDPTEVVLPQHATIGAAIRFRAATQPDHPAIVTSGSAPLTYRELQSLIDQTRAALRAAGLGPQARIAVAMPDSIHAALAIIAVSSAAVSIPVNPKQTLSELEASFDKLQPGAVLLAREDDSAARAAAERLGIPIIEATLDRSRIGFQVGAGQALSGRAGEADDPDPESPAFILQTSGSAAEPKLIPFSHRNMLAAAARNQSWFKLSPQDRCLSASPPFYSHGLKVTVLTPLLSGGTVVFPADASRFTFSEWFEELKPTWYSAGPTLHRLIFDQVRSEANAPERHALRFILSGGAPLPQNVLEGLRDALDVPVVEHYGSSEAAQIAANLPPPGRSKPGTCGVPWPGTVRIVGEDGSELPPGERGEILVGGPTLISGYLNAPELNRASFSDGWFRTGDIGSLDEDGFLTLRGRMSDVINRGGEKISPPEIDDALMRHPAVAEAAAFPVPHPRLGQDVAAAVVLRPGMTVTPVELRKFLQDQLASFKVPRRILVRDQLPKGKTGKVVRRQLADQLGESPAAQAAPAKSTPADSAAANTLVVQLTELWERLLQTSPVSIDDDFADKGGDSLLAMEMLSEVEKLTGQTIPASVLFEARTIRQLAQALSEQNIQPKPVIKMNAEGHLPPLFLFHGDYNGGGLYAARLATMLGAEQPVFVVAPHDLGQEPIPLSVPAIAANLLPLVREAQPKGPYRLSGYCLGGLVAFEVARLLVAAGEKVEMVGMIDPPTVSARPSMKMTLWAMRPARLVNKPFAERVMKRVYYIFSQIDRPADSLQSWLENVFKWQHNERDANLFSVLDYSPKPVNGPVIYFQAAYGPAAWRRLSQGIETIKMSGNHADVVRDPDDLRTIALHLRSSLETHRQAPGT